MNSQHPLVRAMSMVSFPPGTWSKRFARDMASKPVTIPLTDREEAALWRIAYIYRRQLTPPLAKEAIERKIDHNWTPARRGQRERCAICTRYLTATRERNSPCPGPPVVRKVVAKQVIVETPTGPQVDFEFEVS